MILVICETSRRTALGERDLSRRSESFSWNMGWEDIRMFALEVDILRLDTVGAWVNEGVSSRVY